MHEEEDIFLDIKLLRNAGAYFLPCKSRSDLVHKVMDRGLCWWNKNLDKMMQTEPPETYCNRLFRRFVPLIARGSQSQTWGTTSGSIAQSIKTRCWRNQSCRLHLAVVGKRKQDQFSRSALGPVFFEQRQTQEHGAYTICTWNLQLPCDSACTTDPLEADLQALIHAVQTAALSTSEGGELAEMCTNWSVHYLAVRGSKGEDWPLMGKKKHEIYSKKKNKQKGRNVEKSPDTSNGTRN